MLSLNDAELYVKMKKKKKLHDAEFELLSEETKTFSKCFQDEISHIYKQKKTTAQTMSPGSSSDISVQRSDSCNWRERETSTSVIPLMTQLYPLSAEKKSARAVDFLPTQVTEDLANQKQGRRDKDGYITCIYCNLQFR